MHYGRRLHAYAGVWPVVIVEVYEGGYALPCINDILEAALMIYDFCLQYAVYSFGYGIVRWLVVFCHGDVYAISLQFLCIGVATVLHASVGVVDEPLQFLSCSLADSRAEGRQGMFRLQRVREAPTDNLA